MSGRGRREPGLRRTVPALLHRPFRDDDAKVSPITRDGEPVTADGGQFSIVSAADEQALVSLRSGEGTQPGLYGVEVMRVDNTGHAVVQATSASSNVKWWCVAGAELTEAAPTMVDGRPRAIEIRRHVNGSPSVRATGSLMTDAVAGRVICTTRGDVVALATGASALTAVRMTADGSVATATLAVESSSPTIDSAYETADGSILAGLRSDSGLVVARLTPSDGRLTTVASQPLTQPRSMLIAVEGEGGSVVDLSEAATAQPAVGRSIEPRPIG